MMVMQAPSLVLASEEREFRRSPEAPSKVRDFTGFQIDQWRLPMAVWENAELVVTELATNACRYSRGAVIGVRFQVLDGCLEIAVWDNNLIFPQKPPLELDLDAEDGRGLMIVAALSRKYGWFRAKRGKVVWAKLDLGGKERG